MTTLHDVHYAYFRCHVEAVTTMTTPDNDRGITRASQRATGIGNRRRFYQRQRQSTRNGSGHSSETPCPPRSHLDLTGTLVDGRLPSPVPMVPRSFHRSIAAQHAYLTKVTRP